MPIVISLIFFFHLGNNYDRDVANVRKHRRVFHEFARRRFKTIDTSSGFTIGVSAFLGDDIALSAFDSPLTSECRESNVILIEKISKAAYRV